MATIGDTFRIQVADGYATYEVAEIHEGTIEGRTVDFCLVEQVADGFDDYTAFFGDEAWLEKRIVDHMVDHERRLRELFGRR